VQKNAARYFTRHFSVNILMKFIITTILLAFSVAFPVLGAEETTIKNAGFVPSNIWYSKSPFFAGEKIRIYTVIFNGSAYDIVGSLEFLDNGIPLGKTDFSVSGGGRVRDVWADWVVTEGKHTITARIAEVSSIGRDGKKRPIVLENTETGKSELVIDLDTDADGVGNTNDADDDNDGVSDVDEVRKGTDPLKKDTDGNGVSDKEEIELAEKRAMAEKNATTTLLAPKGSIAGTLEKVEDAIPEPVKTGAVLGVNTIEQFRVGEGYQFRLAKEEKAREIASIKASEAATSTSKQNIQGATDRMLNAAEKPFAYVLFAIFAVLQYMFEWQILFYGFISYVVYRVIKWVIRRGQNR